MITLDSQRKLRTVPFLMKSDTGNIWLVIERCSYNHVKAIKLHSGSGIQYPIGALQDMPENHPNWHLYTGTLEMRNK